MNTKTITVTLPIDLLQKVDLVAKKDNKKRSELICEALRAYIMNKNEWEDIFAYGKKQMKKMGIKSEEEINRIVSDFRHGNKN